jgi:outer membrane protein
MKTLLSALCLVALALPALGAEKEMKIGYVDLTRVLDQYERRPELEGQLRDLQTTLSEQDNAQVQTIRKIEQEMQQLALGSPERMALDEKYKQAVAEAEQFRRKGHDRMNQEYVKLLQALFRDASEVINGIAREKDLDFVFKDQSADEQPLTRPEVILQLSQRVVLYAKPEYDLTDEVVKRLNDKYLTVAEKRQEQEAPAAEPKP